MMYKINVYESKIFLGSYDIVSIPKVNDKLTIHWSGKKTSLVVTQVGYSIGEKTSVFVDTFKEDEKDA